MRASDRPLLSALPHYVRRHVLQQLRVSEQRSGMGQVYTALHRHHLTMADILQVLVASARDGDVRGTEGLRCILAALPSLDHLLPFLEPELQLRVLASADHHLHPPGISVADLTIIRGISLPELHLAVSRGELTLVPDALAHTPDPEYSVGEEETEDSASTPPEYLPGLPPL